MDLKLKPINMKLNNEDLLALRERNEQRAAVAKAALGTKWIMHPANSPKHLEKTSVLPQKKY